MQGVNSAENDFQGTMSADRLLLCFASTRPGGLDTTDIWCASRTSPTGPFGVPVNQVSVNSTSDDRNPGLSADGTELFFSSSRPGGAGGIDLYRAPFVAAAGAFGTPEPLSGINTEVSEQAPTLASDGLTLFYHAPSAVESNGLDIFVATRASSTSDFGPGVPVTGLATLAAEREAGPCPDLSFMTFCTGTEAPFSLSGAPRLPGGGFGPQAPLEIGLPPGDGQACGSTVMSDGSLLLHVGSPSDLYIAPPLR